MESEWSWDSSASILGAPCSLGSDASSLEFLLSCAEMVTPDVQAPHTKSLPSAENSHFLPIGLKAKLELEINAGLFPEPPLFKASNLTFHGQGTEAVCTQPHWVPPVREGTMLRKPRQAIQLLWCRGMLPSVGVSWRGGPFCRCHTDFSSQPEPPQIGSWVTQGFSQQPRHRSKHGRNSSR